MLEGLITAFCGLLFYVAIAAWCQRDMDNHNKRMRKEDELKETIRTLGDALVRVKETSDDAHSRDIAEAELRKVYGD